MTTPAVPRTRIYAAFAAVYVLWGSTYLGMRFALETMPPFFAAGGRFVIAGALLYAIARRGGAPPPARVHWRASFMVGGLLFLIGNGGIMWAELTVPSGPAALIVATVPLWMALLGWLFFGNGRPGFRTFAGLAIGFAGVVLLVGPGEIEHQVNPVGALVLIFSAFAWATGSLLSRRLPAPPSALLGAAMNLFAGGVLLLAASLLAGEWSSLRPETFSLKSWLAVVYLVVFGSILGFSAYMWLLKVVPPNRVATYAYVNPVVAVFLGWALGGEALSPQMLGAAAVIVTAVVLITSAQASRSAPRLNLPQPPAARVPQPGEKPSTV